MGLVRERMILRRMGLLAGAIHVCAAVEVPGYQDEYKPLPGTERYSAESLVRNFEDVFDEQMLEALHRELEPLDSIAKGSGALRNSKRVMPTHCFAFGAILEDRRVRRKARAGKCG